MLFDTHCHLDIDSFDADRDEVIARVAGAGVIGLVTVGIDVPSSRRATELARRYAGHGVYAAVGVHPNDCADAPATWQESIRDLAGEPRVVAIGETGLDFYRDQAPRNTQEAFFRDQLALARELDLPIIIHCRESLDRTLELIDDEAATRGGPVRGILHCFSGTEEQMRRGAALGLMFGFGGTVTYKKNQALREVLADVSEQRLLVETDAPFLPPQPYRGRRNEPAYVVETAQIVADARKTTVAEIERITTLNAGRLFGLESFVQAHGKALQA